jgi:hypothetical protein
MSIATYDLASLTYDTATTAYDGSGAGLATQPVVGVFIAFNDGAYVADPDWVEVTQFVRNVSVRRGRGDDLQNFPTGTASVTLDNRQRLFDPFNTTGVYYGKLKPRRQIKIIGQWAGVNYPIYRGYIAGWPVGESDAGKDSTVQLDCFDALGLLAAEPTAFDPLYGYTKSLLPFDYWRCADDAASTVLKNEIRDNTLLTGVTKPKFSSVSPFQRTLKTNAANAYDYVTTSVADPSSAPATQSSKSLVFWSKNTNPYQTKVSMWRKDVFMSVTMTTSIIELFVVSVTATTSTSYKTTISNLYNCGDPHHFVATFDGATSTIRIYVDGVNATQTVVLSTSGKSPIEWFTLETGIFQEISAYDYALSASQALTLYQLSAEQILESTTARATRILSDSSFSSSLVSLPVAPVETVSQVTTGSTTLNELQEVSESEGGELYVSSSGVVTLVNRDYFAGSARSNTSQMTFTDAGTGVGYDAGSLSMAFDADKVRNSVEITFSNGGSTIARDATSIADNGEAGESVATLIATVTNATVLAQRLTTIYKNPKLRIEPFSVNGGRNPTYDWERLLALELLDRFTFKRAPTVGSAIEQDMLLQSIEHTITPSSWVTTVNGSARFTGWFIVGVSLIGGTDVLL